MTAKQSAGILLFRRCGGRLQVLLVHPGGPFWANKDAGAWTIPKGEPEPGEGLQEVALREFAEETGCSVSGPLIPLGWIQQKSGKVVHAWAIEGDLDPAKVHSNTFEMEWPPKSGRRSTFPEVDKAGWFSLEDARDKINPAQIELLERLQKRV